MTEDNQLRKTHVIHKMLYHWLDQKCACSANKPCERCFVLDEALNVFPAEASTVVNIRYSEMKRFN
jgi:hypothetical protein